MPLSTVLAVCPNTRELWIYTGCQDPDSRSWERKWVLREHELTITGVDWCAATNKLVTCGQDRNAFVWSLEGGTWVPSVVVLDINRAATDVKWSPNGSKFAVSSSSKTAIICFYDASNKWWVGRATKRHKSTVLTVAWHPSGLLIATGSTDYRARVLSAGLTDVDGESQVSPFGGPLLPVGEVLAEFEVTKAWVNDVAWSPSGSSLAFAGHDSCLHVVVFTPGAEPVVSSLKCTGLPLMRLLFLSETVLVGAGHGLSPEVFAREGQGGAWECLGRLEKQGVEAGGAGKPAASGFGAARAMFASKVTKGQGAGEEAEAGWTRHASAVTYMQSRKRNANGLVVEFSTSGNDGRVATWPLADFVTNLDSRGSMQALGLA